MLERNSIKGNNVCLKIVLNVELQTMNLTQTSFSIWGSIKLLSSFLGNLGHQEPNATTHVNS